MRNRFPVFSLQSAIAFFLPGVLLIAIAQEDLFITVSTPPSGTNTPAENADSLFTTVSSPAASSPAPVARPVPVQVSAPPAKVAPPPTQSVESSVAEKNNVEKSEQEPLRDPFWPIGFFPKDWQKKAAEAGLSSESVWNVAAGKIRISGTSQLGGRTVAIINGELKSVGDLIDVLHEGKAYQWQIVGIDVNGQVQLKKQGIK